MVLKEKALQEYDDWLAGLLSGESAPVRQRSPRKLVEQIDIGKPPAVKVAIVLASLVHITSGLLQFDESRVRGDRARC
jgi:hypothetical protein